MKTSPEGVQLIKDSEGFSSIAYVCPAGHLTIGFGHIQGVKKGDTISPDAAEELLRKDLEYYEDAVNRFVSVPLTQGQFDALASFAFNLGTVALQKSTLLRLLNAGDVPGAAAQFDRWVYAGDKRLPGLVTRRQRERALFEKETP